MPTPVEPVVGKTPLPGEWVERAACRGWPTYWWFPMGEAKYAMRTPTEKEEDAQTARRICMSCPVAADCLAHAVRYHELGIWAALDEKDRRRLIERYRRHPNATHRHHRRAS